MFIVNRMSNSDIDIPGIGIKRKPLLINMATAVTYNTSCIALALHLIAFNVFKNFLE